MSALVLCLFLQEDVLIPASDRDKGLYDRMGIKCANAFRWIDSEPKKAIAELDEVIESELPKMERRLRVEISKGDINEYDFFPYQFRGRAKIALAKSEPAKAEAHLASAVEDLEVSVRKGAKSSEPYLRKAREDLAKLRKSPPDPREELRSRWRGLLVSKKFKSARALLDSEGSAFDESERRTMVQETEDACRSHIAGTLRDFSEGPHYSGLSTVDLDTRFRLPDAAELCVDSPLFRWAGGQRELIRQLRSKADGVDLALARQMIDAVPLAPAEKNPWFEVTAVLYHDYLEARLRAMRDQAPGADRSGRRNLRAAAARLLAAWKETCGRAGPKLVENVYVLRATQLESVTMSFPIDPEELDAIDLDGCLASKSPIAFLTESVEKLQSIRRTPHLSDEARRRTLTFLIAAAALRDLLSGRTEAQIAESLREESAELKKAGGAVEKKRWGPRVERIFKSLE